uniref:Uncharacterized protein n=1 Tax=Globisporangium ultimum (strain ATCC 200006 / CBS 805.95 / DAOM BR144) TaxID=431595 RepID=K3WDK7_GLOUD
PTTNGGHVERDFTTDLALHRLKPNAGGRERYSTDFDAFDADLEPNGLHGEDDFDDNHSDKSDKSSGRLSSSRHTKLTDLEARVRTLERDNLHLKQTLLLGKNGSVMIAGRGSRESIQRMLSERTKVVTEMVEQLNASFLTIGDASRVWHQDCRVGV